MSTTCFLMFPVFRHECRGGEGRGFPVRFPGYFVNTTLAVPSLRLPRVTTTGTPRRAEARTTCAAHSSVCLHYKPQSFPPSQMSQFCFFAWLCCVYFSPSRLRVFIAGSTGILEMRCVQGTQPRSSVPYMSLVSRLQGWQSLGDGTSGLVLSSV